jgi:SAM-dependent methyltransferase
VTGVDFAWRAIQLARQKARAAGVAVDFRLGDVTRLGWLAGPFDLIFDLGCFHGLPAGGQLAYARHVQRLLAPDGTFLLYVMFRAEAQTNQVGIIESDLGCFAPALRLIHRADGTDATRGCPAAWLTYQRRH